MVFNSCVVVAIQVDLLMWKWMYHTIAWKMYNGRLLERKKRGIPLCWLILKNGLNFLRLFLFPKRQFLYKSNAFSSADRTLYSHIVLLKDHLHLLTHWWCSTLSNDMSLCIWKKFITFRTFNLWLPHRNSFKSHLHYHMHIFNVNLANYQ